MPTWTAFLDRIGSRLGEIEALATEFLGKARIEHFRNDPSSGILIVAPPNYWGKVADDARPLQMRLLETYNRWFELFSLLLQEPPSDLAETVAKTHKFLIDWFNQEGGDWGVPETIPQAKSQLHEEIDVFRLVLSHFSRLEGTNVVAVPDTNALLLCPDLDRYGEALGVQSFEIVLLPTVLAELDQLKVTGKTEELRERAKSVVRRIKGLRIQGPLHLGVTVSKSIRMRSVAGEPKFNAMPHHFDPENKDDRILASALDVQRHTPSSAVVLMTGDINLQNKAAFIEFPFVEPPDASA